MDIDTHKITGDHQCGFRRSRANNYQIFRIRLTPKKEWEYNGKLHQLFIDLKKAFDSVRRKVLYNIIIEFGIRMKLVRTIKMCLNETYIKFRIGKHLSDKCLTQNVLKQEDALSPLLFDFPSELDISKFR
jgi:hypothetical protein